MVSREHLGCEFDVGDFVVAKFDDDKTFWTCRDKVGYPIYIIVNPEHLGLVIDVEYVSVLGVMVKVLVGTQVCYARPTGLRKV